MSVRTIAIYNGSTVVTRVLDAESVSKALKTNLTEDLVWNAANRWTLDVTDVPKEVLDYLETDEDFTVEQRELGASNGPFAEPPTDDAFDDDENV